MSITILFAVVALSVAACVHIDACKFLLFGHLLSASSYQLLIVALLCCYNSLYKLRHLYLSLVSQDNLFLDSKLLTYFGASLPKRKIDASTSLDHASFV